MAFEMLKTDYKDDILNTSINQIRKYMVVNNADNSISLVDVTSYSTVGTFIGAKDINLICKNMNTIMGYIETSSGDLAQEFQNYFNEQKGIFEDNVEAYMQDFQSNSESQFTVWYDANTAAWSQEVNNRINAIIASLTTLVEDNGLFVLNKAYKVGNLLTWNIGDGITRGYLVINPVPANMGIYPTNATYFMEVTREGAQGVGLGMTPRGNWIELLTYVENDWVVHNWIYWRCKTENTDSEPSESNANWEKIYDITAEMPIQFDEPEENNSSFMEVLGNIISGQTLGNLFKYIKGSFLKLLKKFGDTEYTATGTAITYDGSNDSSVIVSNISASTSDFYIIAENNGENLIDLSNVADSNFVVDRANQIVTINGNYALTTKSVVDNHETIPGTYILKIVELSGTLTGKITIYYELKDETSGVFVEYAVLSSDNFHSVEFTVNELAFIGRIRVKGDLASGTTANKYAFMVVVCKKDVEHKANGTLVSAGSNNTYTLNSYEGSTKVFTTSTEQVSFTADFKTRFWYLQNKKIEKANISKNFATEDWEQVAAAPLVKELKEDVNQLNDRFNIVNGTIIGEFNMTIASDAHIRKQGRICYCSFVGTTTTSFPATATVKIATVSISPKNIPFTRVVFGTTTGVVGTGHLTTSGELHIRFAVTVGSGVAVLANFSYEA